MLKILITKAAVFFGKFLNGIRVIASAKITPSSTIAKKWRMTAAVAVMACSPILLGGCGVAQVAVEAQREAAKDVRLVKSPHYDQAKVTGYQRVAVLVRGANNEGGGANFLLGGMGATGGSSGEVLQSRIEQSLVRVGYDIVGQDEIEEAASDEDLERPSERVIVRLAKQIGVDVVIVGLAESGSAMKFGFFGVGAGQESGIVHASFKFVDTDSRKNMAILSVDYKEPKTATEVMDLIGTHFADVLKGRAEDIEAK